MLSRRNLLKGLGAASVVAAGSRFVPTAGVARAQMAETIGDVFVIRRGPVTIHSYIAPDASFQVTAHIIETANSLVIVDTQIAQTFVAEFRAYADSLGKPIERVILSHEHPDHWGGGSQFADVPFVATAATSETLAATAEAALEELSNLFGDEAPTEVNIPEAAIEVGEEVIDGVTFQFSTEENAEAAEHLLVKVPEARVLIVQDLVYSNAHFFPGIDRSNWISILEGLRTTEDADLLLPGHGYPATFGTLDVAIDYLTMANELAANAETADDIIAGLTEAYPTFGVQGLLTFWPLFFQA